MPNSEKSPKNYEEEVVGIMTAGGLAKRISPLPCSKEIYPVGFHSGDEVGILRPKVACQHLLEGMKFAGISKVYIVLRNGKWDIPAYLKDGASMNMHFAYLIMNLPFGVPYTLDQAYPFVLDSKIAFGFPDIIFQPDNVFTELLARQDETNADIVLGLFPVNQPKKWDMVELSEEENIIQIRIKPPTTKLKYAWINAVWTPVFTNFMHEYLMSRSIDRNPTKEKNELHLGNVIQAAINDNLKVDRVLFPHGSCLDIGTPEDLVTAVQISE